MRHDYLGKRTGKKRRSRYQPIGGEGVSPTPTPIPTPTPFIPSTDPGVGGVRAPKATDVATIDDTTVVTYTDPNGYLDDACQIPQKRAKVERVSYEITTGITLTRADDIEFYGGRVPMERIHALRGHLPWFDGLETVRRLYREIDIDRHEGTRRRAFWSVDGDEIDLIRQSEGRDDCYRSLKRVRSRGSKTARFMANVGAAAYRTQGNYIWNGASLVAAVDALEARGIRCEIWTVQYSQGVNLDAGPKSNTIRIRVKALEEPVDLATLTVWCAHLGARRVSYFGWLAAQPRSHPDNLGMPLLEIPASIVTYWNEADGHDVYMWPFCANREQAEAALKRLEETI